MILQINLARIINRYSGGAVITPWNIGDLSEEWIDVFHALAFDLPEYERGAKQVEDLFAKWRKAMKYR